MYAVTILESAEDDIVDCIAYVHRQWGSAVAHGAYKGLMSKLALLGTQPIWAAQFPSLPVSA